MLYRLVAVVFLLTKSCFDAIFWNNMKRFYLQARVLYDFEGQPGTSELSITTGEILNVTSKDVGEGWWEGSNQRGLSGIFPAAYVEVYMTLTLLTVDFKN